LISSLWKDDLFFGTMILSEKQDVSTFPVETKKNAASQKEAAFCLITT
jgi:hypothetical protein